jgi:endo-alpha-1,4-polygalactosaminidase (GH114 family)
MKRHHLHWIVYLTPFILAMLLLACSVGLSDLSSTATPAGTSDDETVEPATLAGTDSHIPVPSTGKLYHAAFPGGVTDWGEEDDITLADLQWYEGHVGKTTVWVYFSHNWFRGPSFPLTTTTWIRDASSLPFIRLMMRSSAAQNQAEPTFTLERIINGDFDPDLRAWARAARDLRSPLIVEYGTEVNGEWFSWNGIWNGAGTLDGYGDPTEFDGPERFRDAYRHIIQLARDEGASNITWVFHVDSDDVPDEEWNRLEHYYPGDEWIDWLGVSVYGAGTPLDTDCASLRDGMDAVYPRLAALSANKPLVLLEFGVTANNPLCDQATWAEAALTDMIGLRWPRLIGFSWWNEKWENDDDPSHDTNMRVQDNPALAGVFQNLVGTDPNVLGRLEAQTSATVTLPLALKNHVGASSGWWQPPVNASWQWQLTALPIDQSFDVDVYDIDLFDNDASTVAALHAGGRKVICYVSVGSWEDWRPDAGQFPASVLGNDYGGWEGEKWLDIRQIDTLAPIMRARLDQCQAKGFDGVEPDNIDAYTNDTGFPLTYQDQLNYNTWLANEAHARGLSIGLKNDGDQVADLLPYFDWALTEDCFADDWCEQMQSFITAGKAVLAAEYTDQMTAGQFSSQVCPRAATLSFSAILKDRDLDAWRHACP